MDLRIVNTCNNNCLYCLENSLRNKEKYISKDFLFTKIFENKERENITLFWWNPLLHPDILEIIIFCNKNWFNWIWLLSNLFWLEKIFITDLIKGWLNTIWIYFNCFDKKNHELVNWWGITYEAYLQNLKFICKTNLNLRVIIHINKLNIDTVARDVLILRKKYWINSFDFVNYFPFDRPYKNRKVLEYSIRDKWSEINNLFKVIKKLNLKVNFVKFSKDFFDKYDEYYDFERGVNKQIWEEDIERLSVKGRPYCLEEKRCDKCFIKDNCKFYGE